MRSSGCSAKNSLSGSEGSADFRLSVHYSSTILALSCHYLEAEVGIDPENSISDRKIAEFWCQSTTIPHYPATILLLSFHSTLLAILLAISSASVDRLDYPRFLA